MKTTFRNFLFFLGLTFPFQACHQDHAPEIPVIQAAELEFIGIEHNEKLQDTFEFLVANQNSMGRKSILSNKQAVEQFLISAQESNSKYPASMNAIGVAYTKQLFASSNQQFARQEVYFEDFELGDRVRIYLEKLNSILSVQTFGDTRVVQEIKVLEETIALENSLSDRELVLLYSATSVARHSYTYWSENHENWAQLGPNWTSQHYSYKTGPAGNIVKADVAGAVAGAVGAWAVNVVVGPGQVAYGGAILGGAVSGSVFQGVIEFLDWAW
jgi:hypothetical protein